MMKIAFCKDTLFRPLERRVPVIVPVRLDIHFLPNGQYFFRLFFILAEELPRIPNPILVKVVQDTQFVLSRREQQLSYDPAAVEEAGVFDFVALYEQQDRMTAKVEVLYPDLYLPIVYVFLCTERDGVIFQQLPAHGVLAKSSWKD